MIKKLIPYKLYLLWSLLLVFCLSCSDQGHYVGDGTFKYFGRLSATNRYVLDIGEIDISSSKIYTYTMSNLPSIEFTFGFNVISNHSVEKAIFDIKPLQSKIKILLINDKGKLVINEEKRLNDLVWSGAANNRDKSFVYLSGQYVPNSNPVQRAGVKEDGGWGSYFTPRNKTAYKLRLEVIEGDANASQYTVIPQARSGGWK